MAGTDPGGAGAYLRAALGAWTGGLGRNDAEHSAQTEMMPGRVPAGARCPRCGTGMQTLSGQPSAKARAFMADCPACGFVALCQPG